MQRRTFLQATAAGSLALGLGPWPVLAGTGNNGTGLVYDPRYLEHEIRPDHPESPARLKAVMRRLEAGGLLDELRRIEPLPHPGAALEAMHGTDHIASIREHYPTSHRVSLLGSGGAVAAVDAVMAGKVRRVFCASRPPGHHARNTGREEGFCYYNHVAIAARHLQQEHGLHRILIADWDYHHGDATEAMFYDRPEVLFFSTHDLHAYPGTGFASRRGDGDGEGFNINVPLDCGAGDRDILRAFEEQLLPAAARFRPEFILISAGFDSRKDDPLGCFEITDQGFRQLTELLTALAAEYCQGRLVSILEGGYNVEGNAAAAAAHVTALMEV